jgi:DNA-binding CsgD family transcriptional regulator
MAIVAMLGAEQPGIPVCADVPEMVESLGSGSFGPTLMAYLATLCGADHCAAFQLDGISLRVVAATSVDPKESAAVQVERYVKQGWWRRDPVMSMVQGDGPSQTPSVVRFDVQSLGDNGLRQAVYPHISDRLIAYGRKNNVAFGLSVVRSELHARFSDEDISRLYASANLIVALLAKHADVVLRRASAADALTSLATIENCLANMSALPRRELEVCSRILYGMSSCGIALDLGVSEETVKTYRKRAYQRLGIGIERELVVWYLNIWSRWCEQGPVHRLVKQVDGSSGMYPDRGVSTSVQSCMKK